MISMMDFQAARWLMQHDVPKQAGNDHPTSIPTGVFPTSDGYINIAAAGDVIYARVCHALGFPELIDDPLFKTGGARSKNRQALNARIAEVTRTDSSANWVQRLNEAEIPCGPIYSMDQVFADEQVRHLGVAQAVEHPELGRIELVGQASRLSRTPARLETATPSHGQHTAEILGELGYNAAEVADLRARKVV